MGSGGSPNRDDVREAWDRAAAPWDDFVENGLDYYRTEVHGPELLAACGEVRGLRVMELGCGQGWLCRQLAERSARVVGVDLSEAQIAQALWHEEENPLGVTYDVMDAANIASKWPPGSFALVTSCMALHDMPDPGAVLKAARTVLVPKGRLVFSVPHPATDTPFREWDRDAEGRKRALKVDRYFESGPVTVRWNMPRLATHWETPSWRRTLSDWSTLVNDAGFLVQQLHEPRPSHEQVRRIPELEDCYRLPYFLVFDCVRVE